MKKLTDTDCIAKVLNGETAYFSRLVERYGRPVFSMIVKIVDSREDAEELTQDVFMKAFDSLSKFRGDSSLSTWLYRIAYNAALSAARKKDMTIDSEDAIDNLAGEEDDFPFDETDPTEELLDRLNIALEQLHPDERAMLLLFYRENRSMDEIAVIVNLTETNVKTKICRIRKKLYTLMNKNR